MLTLDDVEMIEKMIKTAVKDAMPEEELPYPLNKHKEPEYIWSIHEPIYNWHKIGLPNSLETVEATFATNMGLNDSVNYHNNYCIYVKPNTILTEDVLSVFDISALDVEVIDGQLYLKTGWYDYDPLSGKIETSIGKPIGWRYVEKFKG